MRILALETSGARGGIALAETATAPPDGLNLIQEVRLAEGLRHSRDLILAAAEACRRAGWDPRAIDLVAVSIGPGSFTGVRIAVTLAKFLAWDTGAKVVAVPSLRALAENAPPDRRCIVPIVDAKRGGLFASIFERRTEGGLEETFGPALIEPEDLARRILLCEAVLPPSVEGLLRRTGRCEPTPPKQPLATLRSTSRLRWPEARVTPAHRGEPHALVLGHGLIKGREALAAFDLAPPDLWDIRPWSIARLGFDLASRGQFADPLRLEPIYLRRPEAEELWERRHEKAHPDS